MTEKKNFCPEFQVYSPDDLNLTWFVFFYEENGKRIRKYGQINRHKTRDERMQAAQELISALREGYEAKPVKKDLKSQLYEQLEAQRPHWRKKSYQTVKSKVDLFIGWIGTREITAETVRAFFSHLANTRHSTTYNHYHQRIKQMLTAAGVGDMMAGIGTVREIRTPARFFQRHQVERLKKRIKEADPELWLFISFIFYCLIRPGELRHLRAGDVLLDEERIIIRGEISKNHKTEYVAIPAAFLEHVYFVRDMAANDLIFPGTASRSKPVGLNTMSSRHRSILRELGFGVEYKLYSWKHTGAVMAVKAGVGLKELQLQLRHHSLDQVNEYLRQMGVSDMRNLQNKFPAL